MSVFWVIGPLSRHFLREHFLWVLQGVAKQLLFPVVPQFTKAFIECLQLPDSHTCDSGLKLEVIKVKV